MVVGDTLGPYRVLAKIGEGGMGEVYRATGTNLKRSVAIKVLPESVAGDAERLARFQREAEVLAALNHPNLAAIYGLVDGPPEAGRYVRGEGPADVVAGFSRPPRALVMELVDGSTLAERVEEGTRLDAQDPTPNAESPTPPNVVSGFSQTKSDLGRTGLPLDEALSIAKQIAEALEAAHEKGIIHRDLKPANIKLPPDGVVKVLDFRLAKLVEPGSGTRDPGLGGAAGDEVATYSPTLSLAATRAGVILGTAAYISPEQAKGRTVDKRSDVWAFGAVLFEMLTGTRAFAGEDISDTLANVLKMEPELDEPPGRGVAACSAGVARLSSERSSGGHP